MKVVSVIKNLDIKRMYKAAAARKNAKNNAENNNTHLITLIVYVIITKATRKAHHLMNVMQISALQILMGIFIEFPMQMMVVLHA